MKSASAEKLIYHVTSANIQKLLLTIIQFQFAFFQIRNNQYCITLMIFIVSLKIPFEPAHLKDNKSVYHSEFRLCHSQFIKNEFEVNKGVIKIRKSRKERQQDGQLKKGSTKHYTENKRSSNPNPNKT